MNREMRLTVAINLAEAFFRTVWEELGVRDFREDGVELTVAVSPLSGHATIRRTAGAPLLDVHVNRLKEHLKEPWEQRPVELRMASFVRDETVQDNADRFIQAVQLCLQEERALSEARTALHFFADTRVEYLMYNAEWREYASRRLRELGVPGGFLRNGSTGRYQFMLGQIPEPEEPWANAALDDRINLVGG